MANYISVDLNLTLVKSGCRLVVKECTPDMVPEDAVFITWFELPEDIAVDKELYEDVFNRPAPDPVTVIRKDGPKLQRGDNVYTIGYSEDIVIRFECIGYL